MYRLVLIGLVLVSGCSRIYLVNPTSPSSSTITTNDPNTPITTDSNIIEFRVNGNTTLAKIKFSDPVDGLTIVNTVLPYDISISTKLTTMFLSIEATPTIYITGANPFLQVQIFVNGNLFREANLSDFTITTLSVSGTWRK